MRAYIIFISLVLISSFTFSQNYIDLLKVNASITPENKFDSSATKTTLNEQQADLTVPVKINNKFSVITGVIYESIQTKLFTNGITKKFGLTCVKLGINKQLSEKWSTTAVLLPKLATDYNAYDQKDFQLGGLALFKYKKHDQLNYKVGLYYNSELFGPFFVPILGLYYLSSNKKFEANIMLPLQADMNYKVFPFMAVGCNFNGQIRSYHLHDVTSEYPNTYVTKSTNELFAYLKFNVTNSIGIQTKVGESFGRSYKVYNENDKVNFGLPLTFIGPKRQQLNSKFSDVMILQIAFTYRLNLDNK